MTEKLFVYGTLKQGYGNNILLACAKFIGPAVSADAVYGMDGMGFPRLYERPDGGNKVRGEIYEIGALTLAACDQLERHPEWYQRKVRDFVTADGENHVAWVYIMPLPEHYVTALNKGHKFSSMSWQDPVNGVLEWPSPAREDEEIDEGQAEIEWNRLDPDERQELYDAWKSSGIEEAEHTATEEWYGNAYDDFDKREPEWQERVAETVREALSYEWASMAYAARLKIEKRD